MPGTDVAGFYTLSPCRAVDTRDADGPPLAAGATRTFVLTGRCGIPVEANAVSVNLTITEPSALGHLTVFPAGTPPPTVSTLNYRGGQTRANNAIVRLGADGAIDVACVQVVGTAHFLIDVNGYFRTP